MISTSEVTSTGALYLVNTSYLLNRLHACVYALLSKLIDPFKKLLLQSQPGVS